ncbi:hypothetical protein JNUCC0626_18455 [Lentzea sp. JNUCC 0626]|uniref:hypothetical protein n=1 Tax=Lentzea sp. JNUCC 0626 TaxID=3367513 RepID=UPI003748852D
MDKQTNALVRELDNQGFAVTRKKNNHYEVRTATGEFVTVLPSTPSEARGRLNALACLRRHGYDDPKRPQRPKRKAA